MAEVKNLKGLCIVHFKTQEVIEKSGGHMPRYQAYVDTSIRSPSGHFIRFNQDKETEIHGWMRVQDLVIDEVLINDMPEGEQVEVVEQEKMKE